MYRSGHGNYLSKIQNRFSLLYTYYIICMLYLFVLPLVNGWLCRPSISRLDVNRVPNPEPLNSVSDPNSLNPDPDPAI